SCLEGSGKRVTPLGRDADRILRPDRGRTLAQVGNGRDLGKPGPIAARDALARYDLLGEDLELFDQDRRLDRVEPSVEPYSHAIIFVVALAVDAQAAHDRGKLVVVGEHGAAVAVNAERLCRKEAGRGRFGEGAEATVAVARPESLRGIV